ncbi:MAG: hypothetical protein LBT89_08170, partial [Planctomycetaceae bacterium]|nr:hypothetical protein [Planctomycetaceae bacterium]
MLTKMVCECGYEIDDIADSVGAEHRCPRCGRRMYVDEAEAEAAFDRLERVQVPTGIETTVSPAAPVPSTTAPLVPRSEDPNATIDLSGLKPGQSVQLSTQIGGGSTQHIDSISPPVKTPGVRVPVESQKPSQPTPHTGDAAVERAVNPFA